MEENINSSNQSLSLTQAWLLYAAAWVGLVAIWFVLASVEWLLGNNSPWLFLALLLGYLGVGVILNLKVLRKLVEWHPMYSTIGNLSKVKSRMIMFWPVSYPYLYLQIAINNHL